MSLSFDNGNVRRPFDPGGLLQANVPMARVAAILGVDSTVIVCLDSCARTAGGIMSITYLQSLPSKLRCKFRSHSRESQRVQLQTFEGQVTKPPLGHITLQTTIGSQSRTIPFLVCDSSAFDVLLGTGALVKFGINIDLAGRMACFGHSGECVPLLDDPRSHASHTRIRPLENSPRPMRFSLYHPTALPV